MSKEPDTVKTRSSFKKEQKRIVIENYKLKQQFNRIDPAKFVIQRNNY